MLKKNENKTDSIQMPQEESDKIRQLVIKTQTESMILDLKKSVLDYTCLQRNFFVETFLRYLWKMLLIV